jgi:hypothetical protein
MVVVTASGANLGADLAVLPSLGGSVFEHV